MVPINYRFVKYETLDICTDAGTKKLSVLIIDKDANEEYWKTRESFTTFIQQLQLSGPEVAKSWHISSAFASKEAFIDFMLEYGQQLWANPDGQVPDQNIFDIPVSYVEDERLFCVLELADGKLVENELWK